VTIRAAAGLVEGAPLDGWLPFGERWARISRDHPWRTLCFLPTASWRVVAGGGEPLLARWRPVGREAAATDWGPRVVSQGEWGRLELAPEAGAEVQAAIFALTAGQET
jgi:hypothetical protein